ncbi:carbonic anhydrase [Neisseria sp. 83E34]|uniref:carbonic anhydrase n=1 Tax=Neisseria sp. 83E34 TaxID=1692264 RepID=UPI0006CE9F35|nr:carbonic anhydrase [Neisseria sp. 83E34]KPN71875.1 carbonate dehydratase [Neisseria sp. 83E34]
MSDSYKAIFENNRKWVESKLRQDPHYFDTLARIQSPEFLYIGCSDSRVTAEELMGVQPGEVFVHRNVGNIVNPIDMNSSSVIRYAVRYLKVKHIIVCGHYNCGGVAAAMEQQDHGALNAWLRNIRDVYRLHRDELDAIEDQQARYDRLVELNVQEQCVNIIKMAMIQKLYVKQGYPIVYGWVFDIRTGLLKDLEIDFKAILSDIMKIYNVSGSKDLSFDKAEEDKLDEE